MTAGMTTATLTAATMTTGDSDNNPAILNSPLLRGVFYLQKAFFFATVVFNIFSKIFTLTSNRTISRISVLVMTGMALFVVLYLLAAFLYPGGSDVDRLAKGFSWRHNYWCELMAPVAQNGMSNTARPVAIIALAVLAISLLLFWYTIPFLFTAKSRLALPMRVCGSGSMLVLPLMLTGRHDSIINIAGLFGCIAIILLLVCLYQARRYFFFGAGILCLLLCGLNNYVYYSKDLLHYLPVIQKVSFLVFLLWFSLMTYALYKRTQYSE